MGGNLRFVRNDRTSYANAFPSFSVSRGTLLGLGSDIVSSSHRLPGRDLPAPAIRLTDANIGARARCGDLFGVITSGIDDLQLRPQRQPVAGRRPDRPQLREQRVRAVFRRQLAGDAEPDADLRPPLREPRRAVRDQRAAGGADLPAAGVLRRSASPAWQAGIPSNPLPHSLHDATTSSGRQRQAQLVRAGQQQLRAARGRRLQPDGGFLES